MTNLSIFSQNSKSFDIGEDIIASIIPYLPDIIKETKKSVDKCYKILQEDDPLSVSSWRASYIKGMIYKNFSTNPILHELVKDLPNKNFLLQLPKYKFIICKSDRNGNPERLFKTRQSQQLFHDCDYLIFSYSVNPDWTFYDLFITSTNIDNNFVISLSSEYQKTVKQKAKSPSVMKPKVKEIKKKKRI